MELRVLAGQCRGWLVSLAVGPRSSRRAVAAKYDDSEWVELRLRRRWYTAEGGNAQCIRQKSESSRSSGEGRSVDKDADEDGGCSCPQ